MRGLTQYPAAGHVEGPRAAIVLAHGAGAGQASPFMVNAARGLASRGISAATFDFPYMTARRRVPDPAPVLEQHWREMIDAARALFSDLPLFIGGKSMGGRIASHVAARRDSGALGGLVFLGYPLHPPGKPQQRRDAHLPSIVEPMLFVQGTRDAFGTAAEIRELLPRLPSATLHEVIDGDHSLKVPARSTRSARSGQARAETTAVFDEVLDVAADWMLTLVPAR
jgi:predicted alpha/beta-hydrolase family hydrolase